MCILSMTNHALVAALSDALVSLSGFRGREDLGWLDELEAKFIDDLKNSHTEGLSEENEVKVVDGALAFLRFAIEEARSRIAEAAEDD
jgi:hypothetical protein